MSKLLIISAILSHCFSYSIHADPPLFEDVEFFSIIVTGPLDTTVSMVKKHLEKRRFDWSDVLYYWRTEDGVSFMLKSRKVDRLPKMTSVQWFFIGMVELEWSGIIKLGSVAQVKVNE